MNPERINRAMRLSHTELLKLDRFSAQTAHEIISTKLGVDLETARTLFGFMRVLNYIEECPGGVFCAARKTQRESSVDSRPERS